MKCLFSILLIFVCVRSQAQDAAPVDSSKTKQEAGTKKAKILVGTASYYADKFNGRQTANGEIYDSKKMTAACNSLPLGTWIRVTNLSNNRSVVVKTNDRLHPRMQRVVDLSRAAAEKLGYIGKGLTRVKVEVLEKKDIKELALK
jgi:rare lipoprotein A